MMPRHKNSAETGPPDRNGGSGKTSHDCIIDISAECGRSSVYAQAACLAPSPLSAELLSEPV
jgi:hypothetical protein